MTQYFRKREVVTAVQFLEKNISELRDLCGPDFDYDDGFCCEGCIPERVEGEGSLGTAAVLVGRRVGTWWATLYEGDWVVKHEDGLEIMVNEFFVRNYVKAVVGD